MKYEFHVGDYVETIGGLIGWISHIDQDYITIIDRENVISGPWHLPEEQYHFVRIGQYDFATQDREITPLDKFEGSVMWTTALEQCRLKINECVDAVNELRAAQKGG